MADDSDKNGLVLYTQGKYFAWYGNGATTITSASSFDLTYGVKNSVTIGLFTDLTIAMKTDVFVGGNLSANLSAGVEFKKSHAVQEAQDASSHGLNNNVLSAGNDIPGAAKIAVLRTILGVLVGAQVISLLAATGIAIALDKTKDEEKVKEANAAVPDDDPTNTMTLENPVPGYVFSLINGGMNILSAIGLIVGIIISKVSSNQLSDNPPSVLSLDKLPAAFLGVRSPLPVNGGAAGLSVSTAALEISATSAQRAYTKNPTLTTIVDFNPAQAPDAALIPGARVRLNAGGDIQSWGGNWLATMSGENRQSAPSHLLQVTDAQGINTTTNLTADSNGVALTADPNNTVSATANGVSAVATTAFMRLTSDAASLGQGGNTLGATASNVQLKFGPSTTLTLDSTGISIGGALTILAPGGPLPTGPDLTALKAQIAQEIAAQAAKQAKITANIERLAVEANANALYAQTLLQTRALTDSVTDNTAPPTK